MINPIALSFKTPCSIQKVKQCVHEFLLAIFRRTIEPLIGFFLKICVFREAALQGRFAKWIILPLTVKIGNTWMQIKGFPSQFTNFEKNRLDKSAQFLAEFAETKKIKTADGTEIKWTFYSSEKFQEWIEAHGGVRLGTQIVPKQAADWKSLKHLAEFKFKETGHAFEVPELMNEANKKCILRCNGFGLPMETDKKWIGLHLAAGFNYALFEWRKEVSIEGFFQDAEAAYQALLQQGFTPFQIKALGYCGSNYVVAHLKEKHHAEGLDVVMIGAHTALRDVIAHGPSPVNRIGLLGLGAIEKNGMDFDNIRKFQTLLPGKASACLIMNPRNEVAPPDTIERLRKVLVQKGPCEIILKPAQYSKEDFDFNRQFQIPEIWQRYAAFLSR
jgi:hypothetical protein